MSKSLYKQGLLPGKVVSAYRVHRSVRKVSALFAISPRLVAKIVREHGPEGLLLPVGGAWAKGKEIPHRHLPSAMADWLRAHPGTKLPRDLDAIVALTNL